MMNTMTSSFGGFTPESRPQPSASMSHCCGRTAFISLTMVFMSADKDATLASPFICSSHAATQHQHVQQPAKSESDLGSRRLVCRFAWIEPNTKWTGVSHGFNTGRAFCSETATANHNTQVRGSIRGERRMANGPWAWIRTGESPQSQSQTPGPGRCCLGLSLSLLRLSRLS